MRVIDSIDTSTPADCFFFHVISAMAEIVRELIAERTRAGLAVVRMRRPQACYDL
ncbi:recombinase family protein [Raoultella planticola]|uniref:recombinase family protein n=1 Tax=Raoultella planticola TaxID=575 RepID=UPI003BAFE6D7